METSSQSQTSFLLEEDVSLIAPDEPPEITSRKIEGTLAGTESTQRFLAQTLSNREVCLYDFSEDEVACAVTDNFGRYAFDEFIPNRNGDLLFQEASNNRLSYPMILRSASPIYQAVVTYFVADSATWHVNDITSAVLEQGNIGSIEDKNILDLRVSQIMRTRFGVNERGRNSFNDDIFVSDPDFSDPSSLGQVLLRAAAAGNISLLNYTAPEPLLANEVFLDRLSTELRQTNIDTNLVLEGVREGSELVRSTFLEIQEVPTSELTSLLNEFQTSFLEIQPIIDGDSDMLEIIVANAEEGSDISTVLEGETLEFDAQLIHPDGTFELVEPEWTTSSGATIDTTGLLLAENVNEDTIVSVSATYQGLTDIKVITIINQAVIISGQIVGVTTVNQASSNGYTLQVTLADGSVSTVEAEWSVTGPAASIDDNGILTTGFVTAETTITVTATYQGQSYTLEVTILNS